MRPLVPLLSALCWLGLLAAAPGALAHRPVAPPQDLVRLEVVDRDSGRALREYPYRDRVYVAGTPGHRYAVRLTNLTGQRVLVVLSVDGVNAVSGETAAPEQAGYVLDPYQRTDIAGWRKDLGEVAQFVFTDLGDSYAVRTGRPHDVGVVGIAVFAERARPAAPPPLARAQQHPGASTDADAVREEAAEGLASRQRLGTGHGQREWSPARRTAFVRASRHPAQLSERHYDDRRNLVAMGVIRQPRRDIAHVPQAFPGGFVPDPPQRR